MTRTVLEPATPLFREARYLLAEDPDIREPAVYHSVLAAVANGNVTFGGIANYVGRKSPQLAHPMAVLEDSGLLAREPDAFRAGRHRYRITDPLINLYHAIIRPQWSRLELGHGDQVWQESAQRFRSQVVGRHFEHLCRVFAVGADPDLFGSAPSEVAPGTVADPSRRGRIEVDVVVLGQPEPGRPRRVLSVGEAKWGKVMGVRHLERLRRARELLASRGFDTRDTRLACYGAAGFDRELTAAQSGEVLLISPEQLYAG